MSTMAGRAGARRRNWGRGFAIGGAVARALAWPVRVYRARQLMLQLARLGDHELRDIGLRRQDLCDATALPFDADPSVHLRRRAESRRRR